MRAKSNRHRFAPEKEQELLSKHEKQALLRPEYRIHLQNTKLPFSVRNKTKSIDFGNTNAYYNTGDDYGMGTGQTPTKINYMQNIEAIQEERTGDNFFKYQSDVNIDSQ